MHELTLLMLIVFTVIWLLVGGTKIAQLRRRQRTMRHFVASRVKQRT